MKEGKRPNSRKKIAGTATVSRLFFVSLPHVTNGGAKMADDYLGRKMEEYMARKASGQSNRRPLATLGRLLLKNRSHRGYDTGFVVREDQLRRMIEVNTRIPSARNQQVLRFRPVLADEAHKVLPHIRLGGALPALRLPFRVPSRMPLSSSARRSKRTATSTWIWASRPRACCSRQRRSA